MHHIVYVFYASKLYEFFDTVSSGLLRAVSLIYIMCARPLTTRNYTKKATPYANTFF